MERYRRVGVRAFQLGGTNMHTCLRGAAVCHLHVQYKRNYVLYVHGCRVVSNTRVPKIRLCFKGQLIACDDQTRQLAWVVCFRITNTQRLCMDFLTEMFYFSHLVSQVWCVK
jgi:hypothetical protein